VKALLQKRKQQITRDHKKSIKLKRETILNRGDTVCSGFNAFEDEEAWLDDELNLKFGDEDALPADEKCEQEEEEGDGDDPTPGEVRRTVPLSSQEIIEIKFNDEDNFKLVNWEKSLLVLCNTRHINTMLQAISRVKDTLPDPEQTKEDTKKKRELLKKAWNAAPDESVDRCYNIDSAVFFSLPKSSWCISFKHAESGRRSTSYTGFKVAKYYDGTADLVPLADRIKMKEQKFIDAIRKWNSVDSSTRGELEFPSWHEEYPPVAAPINNRTTRLQEAKVAVRTSLASGSSNSPTTSPPSATSATTSSTQASRECNDSQPSSGFPATQQCSSGLHTPNGDNSPSTPRTSKRKILSESPAFSVAGDSPLPSTRSRASRSPIESSGSRAKPPMCSPRMVD
jgi:hypothetical protein